MKSVLVVVVVVVVAAVQATYFRNLRVCQPMNNFDAEFPSIIDTVMPESEPFFSIETATNFFRNIMKFNDREMQEVTDDAINFFKTVYGVDFSDTPTGENGVRFSNEFDATFIPFELNPALGYSTTFNEWTVNGARRSFCVDSRNGGFVVIFGSDQTLRGTYGGEAGLPIRANERLLYGFYNIPLCIQSPLVIQFQSASPARIDPVDGFVIINCALSSNELGPGLAQGLVRRG